MWTKLEMIPNKTACWWRPVVMQTPVFGGSHMHKTLENQYIVFLVTNRNALIHTYLFTWFLWALQLLTTHLLFIFNQLYNAGSWQDLCIPWQVSSCISQQNFRAKSWWNPKGENKPAQDCDMTQKNFFFTKYSLQELSAPHSCRVLKNPLYGCFHNLLKSTVGEM